MEGKVVNIKVCISHQLHHRLKVKYYVIHQVTVSNKLRKGWEDYYKILDNQYKNEIAKQDSIIAKIETSTVKGKAELENAVFIKNEIENTGLTTPILSNKESKNYKLALQKELEGITFLLNKNIDEAISAFSSSENTYNSFHQVYEIERYLKEKSKSNNLRDDNFWKMIYKDLLEKYNWNMPEAIKSEMERQTHN